jgi:hypothetical protein
MAKKTPVKSAKTKKPAQSAAAKSNESAAPKGPRTLKKIKYKSFQLQKRVKQVEKPLPGSWKILGTALSTLKNNKKLFLGIAVIYGLLTAILVTGFSSTDVSGAKQSFQQLFTGHLGQLVSGTSFFLGLLGDQTGNSASPSSGVYQVIVGLIISLAVIWTLRQLQAGNKVRIRDGFYQGMYPLVPVVLVLLVIGMELIPLGGGAWLYSAIMSNGIAVSSVEQVMWFILFFLLALISIYMICSTLFALYIVSLPNVTPMQAIRGANQLVMHRRWTILRKVLFLPVALVVMVAAIMIPFIVFLTPAASWVFFVVSMFLLPIIHGYLYTLYKALL